MDIILPIVLIISAYLLGSISTAVLASKLFNFPDPRSNGSNNPGTTNVLRLGGKIPAAFTLLGDVLKGLVPVIIAKSFGLSDLWIVLVAIAACAGHLFPLYYGFKGGKGVATAMGIFIGLNPIIGLAVLATWLSAAFAFNTSSIAALIAMLFAPFYFFLVTGSGALGFGLLIITALVYWKHIPNIQRILMGTENKIIQS
ncbi:glycerol-3-phosphate 1-O-acyltransferase PlsY [Leucothrix pacifica]|uniref:Glycerol-3-phosphate acyltransferase n=1 Tax=Leucothrix pacifica TaxID=1247513 RepID=A0A317CFA2_9GAMM|nr:glycerol-3-phosphate 1-O-acyltransferase PlsY [Leucothrix pacifica]PWQ96083.1 acyl-phosphate glycerol 3-phosphate acyltransferase [Leucothrix pacifica]